ncbi:MAG: oligosaccharide flippase family protein [Candidatus Absconditabacteria bacterium]
MSYKLVVKDAFWQILGRVISAIIGFFVVKLTSPYLGSLRWGDYSTILKYFAVWSAFADFGLYVIALKKLGELKKGNEYDKDKLEVEYGKFIGSRIVMIIFVYSITLIIAFLIPSYTSNPYIVRGLPLGMLFSASFMAAGILQLPLQIFWNMKQVTISLIVARIAQIIVILFTILFLFQKVDFNSFSNDSIIAFQLILLSVVISGIAQAIYVFYASKKYIKYKISFNWSFFKENVLKNRKYGLSYYLSSFHTLLVLIVLSIFFPTVANFDYAGTWALALTLIEIMLIIPSALGNSIIHKIGGSNQEAKMISFGNLMGFIMWIGAICLFNFALYSKHIIFFVGKETFLSTSAAVGSDFILPFLGIVLFLSFIKQVFNYIFVSTNLQNNLFYINLTGVIIGSIIGIPLIWNYNIIGGIITQILLEILFVAGAIIVAYKNNVLPKVPIKGTLVIVLITLFIGLASKLINIPYNNGAAYFAYIIFINLIVLAACYKPLKPILKNM